jgi:tagaturonate reductase
LIDANGDTLRRTVMETAARWELGAEFIAWVERANLFTNTLVDRIVTGFPRNEAEAIWNELGYRDELLNAGEVFYFWAIESPAAVAKELPLSEAGFHVTWTNDLRPYRDRKIRLLNGAHTSVALAAYLAGKRTVRECMDDPVTEQFVRGFLDEEAIPTLDLPRVDLEAFAAAVLDRFRNPYLRHELLSIALYSVSKFRARLLPAIDVYLARTGRLPRRIVFALAALIAFYRTPDRRDESAVLSRFDELASGSIVPAVLAETPWWGRDLRTIPGLEGAVSGHLDRIDSQGAYAAIKEVTQA